MDIEDTEACYRAVKSRDRRFDGVFYTGGHLDRHLLPAVLPGDHAGPEATSPSTARPPPRRPPASGPASAACPTPRPGSPDWDVAADVAGRAMRLIADGVVERDGVDGLAAPGRLHPAAPAAAAHRRARRRPAGPGPGPPRAERPDPHRDHRDAVRRRRLRGRLRQRPAVQRHDPRGLRRHARPSCAAGSPAAPARRPGRLELRLPVRAPYAGGEVLRFLAAHLVPGVEAERPGLVRAHAVACRTGRPRPADASRPTTGDRHRVRALRADRRTTCATSAPPSSAAAGCSTPTATRSRSTTSSPTTRGWPPLVAAPPGAAGARAASTATRSRSGP